MGGIELSTRSLEISFLVVSAARLKQHGLEELLVFSAMARDPVFEDMEECRLMRGDDVANLIVGVPDCFEEVDEDIRDSRDDVVMKQGPLGLELGGGAEHVCQRRFIDSVVGLRAAQAFINRTDKRRANGYEVGRGVLEQNLGFFVRHPFRSRPLMQLCGERRDELNRLANLGAVSEYVGSRHDDFKDVTRLAPLDTDVRL
jgi:hypothetical protein